MNSIYFTEAIYQLYPTVVSTSGEVAYDAQGNEVVYDSVAVQAEADKLSCKAQAKYGKSFIVISQLVCGLFVEF